MRWKLVTWSSARCQFLATEALNARMYMVYLAIISPAWRHSGSYRSANKGKPLATSTSEILMQKVIKQFSIRRLLRLDLTNDNALRYQGTSV